MQSWIGSRAGAAHNFFLLLLLVQLACTEGAGTADPITGSLAIAVSEGAAQTAAAGKAVLIAPSVRVTRNGNPASGIAVTFAVASGAGTVSGGSAMTNAAGVAQVGSWTLGTTAGPNTLTASTSGSEVVSASFTATAVAGPAATISKQAGDAQTMPVATSVSTRPSVRVSDQYNNPIAGATVNFAIEQGGGTLAGTSTTAGVTTDANGVATVPNWTIGTTVETNTLSATVAGVAPAVFTVSATSGAPNRLSKVFGDALTGTVGQPAPVPPTVKVTDAFGNAVSNVTVVFAPASASGSVSGGTVTTRSDGTAAVGGWTLGTTAGQQSLNATVSGITSAAVFSASVRAGPAAVLAHVSGDQQTTIAGSDVLQPVVVRVTDTFGNAVSGIPVNFSVAAGGGSLSGASVATGLDGLATLGAWRLGNMAGSNNISVTATTNSAPFISPISLSATGVAGPAAILSKAGGDQQSATTGSQLTISPSVKLTDQFGNEITGAAVTFAMAAGGGSIVGANSTTNANGIAALGGWTLGPTLGLNSITASAGSFNVTFTANATGTLNPAQYAGTYEGTWIDRNFGTVSTGTVFINVIGSRIIVSATATGTLMILGGFETLNRSVFGASDATTGGGTFSATLFPLGGVTASYSATATPGVAALEATGVNPWNFGIRIWTASGTITPTNLDLNYVVTFKSGTQATGSINFKKR